MPPLIQVDNAVGRRDGVKEEVLMIIPDPRFARAFNKATFQFRHEFHDQEIYSIGMLIDLARRLGPSSAYWSTKPITAEAGWDSGGATTSLTDALRDLEGSNALVVLKDVERDPVFGPVFKRALASLPDLVGPALQDEAVHGRATLLVASPRRVTGYHIDAESNFLLQLRGSKTVHVFDGSDRTLLPDAELEAFYAGDLNGARFRPDRQDGAIHYDFGPGCGIHVPLDWPHWVQNGNEVSVSISINYDLRSNVRRAKVLRVNSKIRRLGIRPSAPGRVSWLDGGKVALFDGMAKVRSLRPAQRI